MPDPNTNPFAAMLPSFFFGSDKNDPRVNPQLRQRIALAMMARDRKFPKNIGEGLSSIGDAIGDRGLMRQMLDADVGDQDRTAALLAGGGAAPAAAPAVAPPPGYAPASPLASAPAVRAIDAAAGPPGVIPPPAAPPAPMPPTSQPPPDINAAPVQPASMLSPNMPTGIQPVDATPIGQAVNPLPMMPQADAPVDPNQLNPLDQNIDPTFARRRAISGIESGGARDPYSLLGAATRTGDRAHGKYQVMGANIPSWTQEALGRSLTPQQFLADKDAQDTVFDKKFGGYANKYGEEGAAKAWYAGEGGMNNPNATDVHGRLTVRGYGQDFSNRLNDGQVPAQRDQITSALLARPGGAPQGDNQPPPQPPMAFSGIQAAPPDPAGGIRPVPQQLAQAQPGAVAGYVPPELKDPTGAPIVPMHPEEKRLRDLVTANPNSQYLPAQVAARIEPYVKEREIRQNEANEKYKADLARVTKQNEMRQQALMTQAERQRADQKAQQELISGNPASTATDPQLLGTPQSPQRTGIPAAPPVPPGVSPKEWSEKQTPEMVKAVSAVQKAKPQFNQMMDLIQQAENHPGKEWAVGPMSGVTGHLPSAQGFKKLMDQIGGQNFLNVYQQLKGGGSITEIEGTKAEAAQARLSTAQTKADFDKAMLDFKNAVRQDMETVQRKVNQPVTAWQRTPDDDPAPDIGQVGTFKGKMREYIGGNPALESSYRTVR